MKTSSTACIMLLLLFGAIRTAAAGLAAPNELPSISLAAHHKLFLAAGTTDKDAKATISDPSEQATIGDPDEQATVDVAGEEATIGDPEEQSEIGDPGEAGNLDDPEEKKRF